jgi:hypothetical protein
MKGIVKSQEREEERERLRDLLRECSAHWWTFMLVDIGTGGHPHWWAAVVDPAS